MKKEIKLLKKLKNYVEKIQLEKDAAENAKKDSITRHIERKWTDSEIDHYNCSLIMNSAGWLGGDYTEADIKTSILRNNAYLFTEEEYAELYYKIHPKEKIK